MRTLTLLLPEAQRNFTQPDSRIMKVTATKKVVQAYNAQAAVDSHAHVIVAAAVTQVENDKKQLVSMTLARRRIGSASSI